VDDGSSVLRRSRHRGAVSARRRSSHDSESRDSRLGEPPATRTPGDSEGRDSESRRRLGDSEGRDSESRLRPCPETPGLGPAESRNSESEARRRLADPESRRRRMSRRLPRRLPRSATEWSARGCSTADGSPSCDRDSVGAPAALRWRDHGHVTAMICTVTAVLRGPPGPTALTALRVGIGSNVVDLDVSGQRHSPGPGQGGAASSRPGYGPGSRRHGTRRLGHWDTRPLQGISD
jgi:hypothetical protein